LGISVAELNLPLIFIRILKFKDEQSINLIDRIPHDQLHFFIGDSRVSLPTHTGRARLPRVNVFDGSVPEAEGNYRLGFPREFTAYGIRSHFLMIVTYLRERVRGARLDGPGDSASIADRS
jgi:hypothetical protein